MNFEILYNELKALQNKAFNLSKTDKELVRQTSKDLNLEFNPKTKCANCYSDQIIILLIELKKKIAVVENFGCSYEMVNNKSIKWAGYYINCETITNEIAEKFISNVNNWEQYIKRK